VPPGVFNLVNGDGPTVGAAIALAPRHRHGLVHRARPARACRSRSTRRRRSRRVTQELGGKSANIILDDADFQTAVAGGVSGVLHEQRASRATRRRACWCRPARHAEAVAIAKAARGAHEGRRSVSGRDQARSGRQRSAVQQDSGADSEGHRRGGPSSSPGASAAPTGSPPAST